MPTEKLTQRFVDSLPETEKLTLYFDSTTTGFGVYTKGKIKTYFIKSRAGKKQIKMTIGRTSLFSLADAKIEAKNKLALMAKGIDPVALKKQEDVTGITLSDAFKQYCIKNICRGGTLFRPYRILIKYQNKGKIRKDAASS